MENYILILLTILVFLVIAIVAFGYSKIERLRTSVNRNTANISALQSFISRINIQPSSFTPSKRSTDDIDVSDSESSGDFDLNNRYDDEKDETNSSSNDEERRVVEVFDDSVLDNNVSDDENVVKNFVEEVVDVVEEVIEEVIDDVVKDNIVEDIVENVVESVANDSVVEETDDDVKSISFGTPKKAKKIPNELAKNYDVGYRMKSINDENMYEVVERKNGAKVWKKVDN